jgi:ribosomal protein L32
VAFSHIELSVTMLFMVVRMRHTRSHTGNRRSHHALEKPTLSKDKAGNFHMRHRLSSTTGMYRDRKVVDLSAKLEKRAKADKAEAR